MPVEDEIDRATNLGQSLEEVVVNRGTITLGATADRDRLLLAHWALTLDLYKSILALFHQKFYGGAFALLRPLIEADVRAHVVIMGSDDDVAKIAHDDYRSNFKTIGAEIDRAFALDGFFDRFLNGARGALHSFTHSGLSQLGRRFKGNDLDAHYDDDEIVEAIRTATSATFMVTNLVVRHFGFTDEAEKINQLFIGWGQR